MQRSSSMRLYYWKRILRLFPGLMIVLLLTICIGFFVYDSNLQSYVSNKSMWLYIPNNLSLYNLQFGIVGVLKNGAINGSLWTIRYEFSFYVLISLLFFFRNKKKLINNIIIISFILLFFGKFLFFEKIGTIGYILGNSNTLNLGLYFIGGSLLASIKIEDNKFKTALFIIAILLLCLSFYLKFFFFSQFIVLPFIVVIVGISSTKYINSLSKIFGDISYGIYIYSFPIQQILMYFFNLNYLQLMGISLILSVFFGFLSWNLVEKKALNFKNLKFKPILIFQRSVY